MFLAKRTLKVAVKALSDNDSSQDANGKSNKSQKTPVDRDGGDDVVSEMMAQNLGSNLRQLHHQEYVSG
jgi:hypothetical protein